MSDEKLDPQPQPAPRLEISRDDPRLAKVREIAASHDHAAGAAVPEEWLYEAGFTSNDIERLRAGEAVFREEPQTALSLDNIGDSVLQTQPQSQPEADQEKLNEPAPHRDPPLPDPAVDPPPPPHPELPAEPDKKREQPLLGVDEPAAEVRQPTAKDHLLLALESVAAGLEHMAGHEPRLKYLLVLAEQVRRRIVQARDADD